MMPRRALGACFDSIKIHAGILLLLLVPELCIALICSHGTALRGPILPRALSTNCSPYHSFIAETSISIPMQPCISVFSFDTDHSSPHKRSGVACRGKKNGGDGQKKPKKEKLEAQAASQEAKQPQSEAQRITNKNFGMSMKTQLKLVKAFKKMEEKSTRTITRTKFRKDKETVEERNAKKLPENTRNIWTGNTLPPVFLVDGYNIIGQWAKLKKKRDNGDMIGARDGLYEEIAQFAHYRGCQCTIIYDAIGNKFGPPITQADLHKTGVETVFVRDESADSYIEAKTAEIKRLKLAGEVDPPEVYICSSDNAIRSISSGHGARTMSSNMFVQEMKRARKEYEGSLMDENHLSRAGGMVEDRIGKDAADKLYAMMEKLEGRQFRPRPEPELSETPDSELSDDSQ